jgi:hypothetical protein
LGIVKTVTVSSTDSALTALVKALDSANISYVEKSGYVSKIGTLAERDHGANSGWQYLVNGSAPTVGAGDYTFKKNATMVWYFTDDYTKEQSSFDSNDSGSNSSSGTPTTETTTPSTTTPAESLPFADVAQDHWAAQSIVFVHDRGLMVGMADGSFSPDSTASRAMIATILWSLESSPEASSDGVFSDVHSGSWYAVPAAWAMENGIVSGYPDGSFAPDAGVTREQLALMFYHWANLRGLDTTVTGQPLSEFQDASGASDWAKDALDWAVSAGLLSGKSATTLDPAGTATRAELAVILTRLVELSES